MVFFLTSLAAYWSGRAALIVMAAPPEEYTVKNGLAKREYV